MTYLEREAAWRKVVEIAESAISDEDKTAAMATVYEPWVETPWEFSVNCTEPPASEIMRIAGMVGRAWRLRAEHTLIGNIEFVTNADLKQITDKISEDGR